MPLAVAALALAAPLTQDPFLADVDRAFPRFLSPVDVAFSGDVAAVATRDATWIVRRDAAGAWQTDTALPDSGVDHFTLGALLFLDADGDGDADLYLGRPDADKLFLDSGAGGFVDASAGLPEESSAPTDAIGGDVDGDGDQDIVLLFGGNLLGRILRNQGGGVFADEPGPGLAYRGELVDVDGDGDLDLLSAQDECLFGFCTGKLATNDGAGNFTDGAFPMALLNARDVAAGDVDGDGDVDFAVASEGGAGAFLFSNVGSGFVQTLLPATPHEGYGVAIVDIENDGDGDLFLTGRDESSALEEVLIVANPGVFVDESFRLPSSPGAKTGRAGSGDVDGDGDDDLFLQSARVMLQGTGGAFFDVTPLDSAEVGGSGDTAFADVDGDGDVDGLRVYLDVLTRLENDGNGEFAQESAGPPAASPTSWWLDLADFDGDGDPDAHLLHFGNPDGIYENDGAGEFTLVTGALPPGFRSNGPTYADVDGDGDLDLAAPGSKDAWNGNQLLLNYSGVFAAVPEAMFPTGSAYTHVAGAGDFDVDGDVDLAYFESGNGRVYRNDGASWTVLATTIPGGHSTRAVDAGDVDQDGFVDLLLGKTSQHPDLIVRGVGGGLFQSTAWLPATQGATEARLVDLDGDGDLDALTGNVWRNTGPVFEAAAPHGLEAFWAGSNYPVGAADFDGDGDVDVIYDGVLQLANTTRHLAWRSPAGLGRPLAIDLFGSPNAPWILGWSPGKAALPIPPFGLLKLDPLGLVVADMGVFVASSVETLEVPVPSAPGLAGVDVHLQALIGTLPAFTNRTSVVLQDL